MKCNLRYIILSILTAVIFSSCGINDRLTFHESSFDTDLFKPTNQNFISTVYEPFVLETTKQNFDLVPSSSDFFETSINENLCSAEKFEPVLRFTVASDIHIYSNSHVGYKRFVDLIQSSYKIAKSDPYYDVLDAIVVAGDISEGGREFQLKSAYDVLSQNVDFKETLPLLTMGNHDYYDGIFYSTEEDLSKVKQDQFNKIFSKLYSSDNENSKLVSKKQVQNSHYIIGGYHFITISPDIKGLDFSADQVNWLKNQLEIAENDTGKYKPIFLFRHVGSSYSILGTDNDYEFGGVKTLDEVLSKYPQLVDFNGHSHEPINNECSILQSDHTYIGTGTSNYSTCLYYGSKKLDYIDLSKFNICQYLIVEVDENSRIRIRIYDDLKDTFVGDEIILDGFTKQDYQYTTNYFKNSKIFFKKSSNIKIINKTSDSINITFDPVDKSSFTATYYRLEITNISTGEKRTEFLPWSYFNEDYSNRLKYQISDLTLGCKYKLEIFGCNSLYTRKISLDDMKSINSLSIEFTLK